MTTGHFVSEPDIEADLPTQGAAEAEELRAVLSFYLCRARVVAAKVKAIKARIARPR